MAEVTLLGRGIYTVSEAALYAKVRPQLVSRWLFGDKRGESVLVPEFAHRAEKIVSFWDFIQILAIRAIRRHPEPELRVSLQKIREAVQAAQREFGTDYPLAMKHKTTFAIFRKEIALRISKPDEDVSRYLQVTGPGKGQHLITPVVEFYMRNVEFRDDGFAAMYRPYIYKDQAIAMDPERRFGEPFLESCGYTARTLWMAVKGEGGIEAAAHVYGVEVNAVEAAYAFVDDLEKEAA